MFRPKDIASAQSAPGLIPGEVDRSQDAVIDAINIYCRSLDKSLLPGTEGYCVGFALLWLKKAMEGQLDWFYQTRDLILDFSQAQPVEQNDDVDKFIDFIYKGQNISELIGEDLQSLAELFPDSHYEKNFFKTKVMQESGEEDVLVPQEVKLTDLKKYFIKRRNVIPICFANLAHAVAILMVNGRYVFFDANYESGMHKVFDDADEMVKEIKFCLFQKFNEQEPESINMLLNLIRSKAKLAELNIDLSRIDKSSYIENWQPQTLAGSRQTFFQPFASIALDVYEPFNQCVIL